jgi:hypothetical protein
MITADHAKPTINSLHLVNDEETLNAILIDLQVSKSELLTSFNQMRANYLTGSYFSELNENVKVDEFDNIQLIDKALSIFLT